MLVLVAITIIGTFATVVVVYSEKLYGDGIPLFYSTDKPIKAIENQYTTVDRLHVDFDQVDLSQINFTNWKYFKSGSYEVFYDPKGCNFRTGAMGGFNKSCNGDRINIIPIEYYPYQSLDDRLWKWRLIINNMICPDNMIGIKNPFDGLLDCYPLDNVALKEHTHD